MDEGYITELSQSQTLPFKDFETKQDFDNILQCFYTKEKKTGLISEVKLFYAAGISKREQFLTTSKGGVHAEFTFVQQAKKWIQMNKETQRVQKISVAILVSNSPCKICREDLENFFTWSKSQLNSQVCAEFTLSVGRLYCDGLPSAEAEIQLSYWQNDLETREFKVSLNAINVCQEVSELKKQLPKTKKQKTSREKADKKTKKHIESIQNGKSYIMNIIKKTKNSPKSDFLEQHFTDVTDGQMMLATVVASGFTESGEKRPTISSGPFTIENEEELIPIIQIHVPHFWESIRKTLALVCARVPSKDCQESITRFLEDKQLEGVKNKLVLYIAKVPEDEERSDFIEWIRCLEESSISVCLQPFYPVEYTPGPIVGHYRTLKTHFQQLKGELEFRPSTPPDSPLNSESEMTLSSDYTSDTSTFSEYSSTSLTESPLSAPDNQEDGRELVLMAYVPTDPYLLGM